MMLLCAARRRGAVVGVHHRRCRRLAAAAPRAGDGARSRSNTNHVVRFASGLPTQEGTTSTKGQPKRRKKEPFLILSLDGGGVRGALTLALLEKIEALAPGLMRRADLIAGTSTGSIIALMLAAGASPMECREIYQAMIPKVFGAPRPMYQRAFASKYDAKPLKEALRAYFGDQTLGALDKRVVVPALRIDGKASHSHSPELWNSQAGLWRPAVFTNLPATPGVSPDVELKAADAALRSSAAPTFFPIYQGYCDGGLWANNPAIVALGKTLLHYPELRRKDVRVLSIGTGVWPRSLHVGHSSSGRNRGDLGVVQWSPYLLDLLMDASALNTELSAAYLLRSHYKRLDPTFANERPVLLDDVSAVDRLVKLGAETDVTSVVDFLAPVLGLHRRSEGVNDNNMALSDDDSEDDDVQDALLSSLGSSDEGAHVDDAAVVVNPLTVASSSSSSSGTASSSSLSLEDHYYDHETHHFEVVGGSSNRLHSRQWAELVDLAWIDLSNRKKRKNLAAAAATGPPPSNETTTTPQQQQHGSDSEKPPGVGARDSDENNNDDHGTGGGGGSPSSSTATISIGGTTSSFPAYIP